LPAAIPVVGNSLHNLRAVSTLPLALIRKKVFHAFVVFFFLMALLIALHQYINYGILFDYKDIHHELFIAVMISVAFTLWIVDDYMYRRSEKQ
jgi:hypothetical protein